MTVRPEVQGSSPTYGNSRSQTIGAKVIRLWSNVSSFQRLAEPLPNFGVEIRFIIAAAVITVAAMGTLGVLVNGHIRSSAVGSVADASAFYMETFFEPLLQDAPHDGVLPPPIEKEIDRLFASSPQGKRLEAVRIWRRDGTLAYSTDKSMTGLKQPSPELDAAFRGMSQAHLERLSDHGSDFQQAVDVPLIEAYFPLYRSGTHEVIAVGEFYENAEILVSHLRRAAFATWSLIAASGAAAISLLSVAAIWTSAKLRSRRDELKKRLLETKELARQNAELRLVAEQAMLNAIQTNENHLNKIGSDLHDGPIQLLSLLVLRLSTPAKDGDGGQTLEIAAEVIRDLRNLAHGLVLPELESMDVEDALRLAVARHKNLTRTKVRASFDGLPDALPAALKTCLYRVVQECLNNAFRHAGGLFRIAHLVGRILHGPPGVHFGRRRRWNHPGRFGPLRHGVADLPQCDAPRSADLHPW